MIKTYPKYTYKFISKQIKFMFVTWASVGTLKS